jgi:hypothetical protein
LMPRVPPKTFSQWFFLWVEDVDRWLTRLTPLFAVLRFVLLIGPLILAWRYNATAPEWMSVVSTMLAVLSFLSFVVQIFARCKLRGARP